MPFDPQGLAALLQNVPPAVQNQWFSNQQVKLDGYRFIRCRFDGCILFVSSGLFVLENCILANCKVVCSEQALRVVKLYNIFAGMGIFTPAGFEATKNIDGTLSIK